MGDLVIGKCQAPMERVAKVLVVAKPHEAKESAVQRALPIRVLRYQEQVACRIHAPGTGLAQVAGSMFLVRRCRASNAALSGMVARLRRRAKEKAVHHRR